MHASCARTNGQIAEREHELDQARREKERATHKAGVAENEEAAQEAHVSTATGRLRGGTSETCLGGEELGPAVVIRSSLMELLVEFSGEVERAAGEDFGTLPDGHVYRLPIMLLFVCQAKIVVHCDLLPPIQLLSFCILLQRIIELLKPLGPPVRHHVHAREPRHR